MKYWAVLSAFLDDGRMLATVVGSKEFDQKPQAGYRETRDADLYVDWLDSKEKAEAVVAEFEED